MEEIRKKILEAAKIEFQENGLTNSSLDAIATRAGVGVASIRAIFVNKEQLIKTLLKEISEPFMNVVEFVADDIDDPKDFFEKSLRLLNRIMYDNPEYVAIFQRIMHDDPEMLGLLMESYFIPSGYFEKLEYFRKNGKINIEGKFIIETMLDSLLFFPHMARSAMEKHIGKENIEEFFESNVEAVLTVFEKGLYR